MSFVILTVCVTKAVITIKRIISSFFLVLVFLCLTCTTSFATDDFNINTELDSLSRYIPELITYDPVSFLSDWVIQSDKRIKVDRNYNDYLSNLETYVTEKYRTIGGLDINRSTEWHRIILTVHALGGMPDAFGKDINGNSINLLNDGIFYRENLTKQGVPGALWALITINETGYTVPDDSLNTLEYLIDYVLDYELTDGGFSSNKQQVDVDITATALRALYPYQSIDERVRNSVSKAIKTLSDIQNADGSYSSFGIPTAETTAQVLISLLEADIDIFNDARFIKNNHTVLDGLLLFRFENGGYKHLLTDEKANTMATQQVYDALSRLYISKSYLSEQTTVQETQITPEKEKEQFKTKNILRIIQFALKVLVIFLLPFSLYSLKTRRKHE